MSRIALDQINDPRLDHYRDLNKANLIRSSGRFIVEGHLLVQRLLGSRFATESVVCSDRWVDRIQPLLTAEIPLYVVPQALISRLVGFQFHRGVLACGRRQPTCPLKQLVRPSLEQLTLVVCPRLVDPTNLGSLIRNACALGAEGLILGPGTADPFSRRVLRVSMGTALELPIRETHNLRGDLVALAHQHNVQLVAAVLDPSAQPLDQASRTARMALLLGSEAEGLEPHWVDLCSRRVTLPMARGTDSLNVATASGIFLYHFLRVGSAVRSVGL